MVLVHDGQLLAYHLRQVRLSEQDLLTAVRKHGYGDLGDGYLSFRSLRRRTRGVVEWPKRTTRPGLTL